MKIDEGTLDTLINDLLDADYEYYEATTAGGSTSEEYIARGEARAALVRYVLEGEV